MGSQGVEVGEGIVLKQERERERLRGVARKRQRDER